MYIFTDISQKLEAKLLVREDDDHAFWVHLRKCCAAPSVRLPENSRQFLWKKTDSLGYTGQNLDEDEIAIEAVILEKVKSLRSLQSDLDSANDQVWRDYVDSPKRGVDLEQRKSYIYSHEEEWDQKINECNETVLAESQQIMTSDPLHVKIKNGLESICYNKKHK